MTEHEKLLRALMREDAAAWREHHQVEDHKDPEPRGKPGPKKTVEMPA